MAIKPAQDINFDSLTLAEIEELEQQEKDRSIKLQEAKIAKIQASKKEAYEELLKVVAKFHLNGGEVINCLLENRKIDFKEVQEIKPVYLIKATVQKKDRKTQMPKDSDFLFYEGKTILADTEQARTVCANGTEAFKATLTANGKKYLADSNTKEILVNFYNSYKPATASKWDGK